MKEAPARTLVVARVVAWSIAMLLLPMAIGGQPASAAEPAPVRRLANGDEPGRWNPAYLHTAVSDAVAQGYLKSFDVQRAALGYLYALPAYIHFKQRYQFLSNFTKYMGDRGNPFGQFLLVRQPASPRTTDVYPNCDTLYGATYLELRDTPMVLSVPDIPDRYYSLALLDAYFYNFDYIGSRTTGQKAGRYLIVGPDWRGPVPGGIDRVIRSPTHSMNIYQRIHFRDQADLAVVREIRDRIGIIPLARFLDPGAPVALPDPQRYLKADPQQITDPVQVLEIANGYMADNPPPAEDGSLVAWFMPVGVGPGLAMPTDPAALDILREGAVQADRAMTGMALAGALVRNGWQIPPSNLGRRGGPGGIALHAMTQVRSIGINVPEEAVYYTAYMDGTQQPLGGAKRYTLTFAKDQLPPVRADTFGFWSVTMYDRASYRLVDSPANKYLVRSVDQLRYGKDGSLSLHIQPDPPADPEQRANWLPSPGDRDFIVSLRVYVGGADVVSGRYTPPAILPTGR